MQPAYFFLRNIFETVDAAVAEYIQATAGNVVEALTPVANQMLTLYIILWGFAMYRGLIQEPVLDAAFRLMKVAIIMNLAISVGSYSDLIANNLFALPEYFVGLLGNGGTTEDSKATLDSVFSDAMYASQSVYEKADIFDNPGAFLVAAIIWLSALLSVGYAAFLIILAKVMIAVLLGIGPIFVICLMFDSTKKFFEAWLGLALNYALISALCIAVIKFMFGMFADAARGALDASRTDEFGIASIASLLLMAVVSLLCLMQVQNLASSLAGGIAISTMGAINWATDKLKSAAGAMRPSNMQKAFQGAKKDAQALRAGGRMAAAPVVWAARKMRGNTNSISKN
ncbi:type IV secretion system protein [Massilia soli]|uniref:Type IV secretion system protein n=1 Tax=Massilia soli TaxID=2792854 RepID=A0ABS7SM68_9BURK|nr:type IV secretion system protein [Massilia soli]MBZ2207147.1 type IV secretion system protein [Massilia soli]